MIKNLSNQELDANLKRLVAGERKILHLILEHINEVELRKLYLEKAYSSLYEYLVQECHYSGSAAMRRISAARLMREVPAVSEKIQSGHLNLSQVSEMSRAIKEKEKSGVVISSLQKAEIVSIISGTTTEETQKYISRKLDLELKVPEKTSVQKDESVHLQITLSKEQYQHLLKCRDKAAATLLTEFQDSSLAATIGFLAEVYLENNGTLTTNSESKNLEIRPTIAPRYHKIPNSENKTLTPNTRKYILNRDRCCQYKDILTGKACGSTFNLEVDHKQSRWAGGDHSQENLQVLCQAHNNYKYKKEANFRLL